MQDRLTPNCFVAPTTSQEVSKIVGLLSKDSCQFAVRSGGHGLLVGSSNIVRGVTIDLRGLDCVTLSADKTTAMVGTGAKWMQVYESLDPLGYSIPGGRAGDVGVGGLTSGGGFAVQCSIPTPVKGANNYQVAILSLRLGTDFSATM